MEISIFKEITTEGVIKSIEENSEKYHVGFYADMNDPKQRKLVKDSAVDINNIIKQVERARIDISKAAKVATDEEAAAIIERLKIANAPFTVLIEEYKAERKKVLDAEKANKEAIEAKIKYESDHELGLLMNKTFAYDREQELKAQAVHEERMKLEAEDAAFKRFESEQKQKEQARINTENAKLENKAHLKEVNNIVLVELMTKCNLDEDQAKSVVIMLAKKEINHVSINY